MAKTKKGEGKLYGVGDAAERENPAFPTETYEGSERGQGIFSAHASAYKAPINEGGYDAVFNHRKGGKK